MGKGTKRNREREALLGVVANAMRHNVFMGRLVMETDYDILFHSMEGKVLGARRDLAHELYLTAMARLKLYDAREELRIERLKQSSPRKRITSKDTRPKKGLPLMDCDYRPSEED